MRPPKVPGDTALNTVNVTAPVVPPLVVTVTLRAVAAAPPEMTNTAEMLVALVTATLLAVTPAPLIEIVAGERKFVPVKVTGTLVPWYPLAGEIDPRVGAALACSRIGFTLTGTVVALGEIEVTSPVVTST